jgi:hypothetical protein
MTTDFRALCAELLRELDHASAWDYQQVLKDQARAALAEPEPKGLTREEAVAVYSEVMAAHECQTLGDMAEHFARAVLARWGK